ncbi:MAG: J domain-containing protein [Anaerolineaceae bacterium]|nr:J domain-containing protein [Anaerolineaceae bacterium]
MADRARRGPDQGTPMNPTLRDWLCQQLRPMVDVRFCMPPPAALSQARPNAPALRVGLWTGVFIHVHSLTTAPKARQLRRLLQEDEEASCASLFTMAVTLAPQADQTFKPPDWMLALHSLGQEQIYVGFVRDRTPGLQPFHLEPLNGGLRHVARFGPSLLPRRLHVGRVSIRHRSVRGFWNLAHFGVEPFWQQAAQERFANARRIDGDTGQGVAGRHAEPGDHILLRSYALLGLQPDAAREEVQEAWRREAFNLHPDVSALPVDVAEERFRALSEALERIRAARGWNR